MPAHWVRGQIAEQPFYDAGRMQVFEGLVKGDDAFQRMRVSATATTSMVSVFAGQTAVSSMILAWRGVVADQTVHFRTGLRVWILALGLEGEISYAERVGE